MGTDLKELQARISAEWRAIHASMAPPLSRRISIREKRFTLPNGITHVGPLAAVILDHRNVNRYYMHAYDPNSPVRPTCIAVAKCFADLSPRNHPDVGRPMADSCLTCTSNQFGSGRDGKGKACRNLVRLAIAAPNACANEVPMILEIPPSSLKHWARYVSHLDAMGLLPIQAITEISFDPSKPYPCVTFKVQRPHDDLETFWTIRESATELLDETARNYAQ